MEFNVTDPINTLNWHIKHSVLQNFYRYAVSRGYVTTTSLPSGVPKCPQPFVQYYVYYRWKDLSGCS